MTQQEADAISLFISSAFEALNEDQRQGLIDYFDKAFSLYCQLENPYNNNAQEAEFSLVRNKAIKTLLNLEYKEKCLDSTFDQDIPEKQDQPREAIEQPRKPSQPVDTSEAVAKLDKLTSLDQIFKDDESDFKELKKDRLNIAITKSLNLGIQALASDSQTTKAKLVHKILEIVLTSLKYTHQTRQAQAINSLDSMISIAKGKNHD